MTAETPPNRRTVSDDDTELVQAINAGHTERFQELVRRYEQKLYNFAGACAGMSPTPRTWSRTPS